MKRQKWFDDDEKQLVVLANHYQEKGLKINWDEISKEFENRTRQQCKSYYTNVIKSKLNITQRENHRWTNEEKMQLLCCAIVYDKDWKSIQYNYFQQFSIKQIQCQYSSLELEIQERAEVYKALEQNCTDILVKQTTKWLQKIYEGTVYCYERIQNFIKCRDVLPDMFEQVLFNQYCQINFDVIIKIMRNELDCRHLK
ncbi:Myb-like_DNA-binding domain-containing protein [Hexamita inflata]|uniref:Myb-like DNA-binding domain-containing protein n=1 Tax=Hexamita inflata TaxID=28002 RepID=A0AA86TWR3_9EUKA|nr:Myb-like DNA-binding domain-containing protein [Hexamita inflata]